MPIVYVHGVNVRRKDEGYEAGLDRLKAYLRRYVAPEISDDPENVPFLPAYWGDDGVSFAWDGRSRPTTQFLGMGAGDTAPLADRVGQVAAVPSAYSDLTAMATVAPTAPSGLVAAGAATDDGAPLTALSDDELSDVLATAALLATGDEAERTVLTIAADEVAHDAGARATIATSRGRTAQVATAASLVEERATALRAQGEYAAQGFGDAVGKVRERLGELVDRASSGPAWVMSHALLEARPKLNAFVTRFIGDVLVYLEARGTVGAPGRIPTVLLDTLVAARAAQQQRGGEPIIVLSHSMGGQVVYDAVTAFLTAPAYAGIRIDFWTAAASQVGLFEEMKTFLASDPRYGTAGGKVPYPDRERLGGWWNVYDRTDVLSFTASAIVDGVDDEEYSSGVPLIGAHSGYFMRPSFFRRFAAKVAAERDAGWHRS